jgi:N-acetyl-1-D-myo-inositol-2-amino-2-deoxy-alpha-D-glucopyranoside deacetylase
MQNIPSPAAAEAASTAVSNPPAEPPAEPLGAGATALSSIFGLLVGIVVGVITTFTHSQLPPWGLIAGLAIVTALVAGFRLVFGSRTVAGAAALGVVGASAVLALPGAGGTALSLDGLTGYLWAFGPVLLSLVVLLVPVRGRRGSA